MIATNASRVDSRLPCVDCGELLPPHGAGKCRRCAGGSGIAGLPIAPHCETCGTALNHDPRGPMAWANAPCKCEPTICPDAHEHYFCSGSNQAGDLEGIALAGDNVGVAADEVGEEAEQALLDLAGMTTKVFVDSGAFSEVDFTPAPVVARPISDEDWNERLGLYCRLATVLRDQLYVVAPDMVAFQAETLVRLARFYDVMRGIRATGANVIMPVQKGAMPMADFFARAQSMLGFEPIAGIPMKKDATSLEELAAFCREARPAAVHLLGKGPASKGYAEALAAIRLASPLTLVYSDSVTVRRLVGRTNGKGKGPRRLTAAQDAARALNPTGSSRQIKRAAAKSVFLKDAWERIAQEKAAGWFDRELFATWEESQEWDRRRALEDLPEQAEQLAA